MQKRNRKQQQQQQHQQQQQPQQQQQGNRGVAASIYRDANGLFLGASVLAVPGIFDPTTLEAIACYEGLSLATDLHLQKMFVASDCLEVINAIIDSSRCS
jgi:hypothetical protein